MGSYGIGPARIVAAAIEQGADEKGIVWPRAIAPWQVQLVTLGQGGRGRRARPPTASTRSSWRGGIDVLYDDRDAGPGEKLTDAELLGCPLRIVVGRKALADGEVETQVRRSGEDRRIGRRGRRGRGGGDARGARVVADRERGADGRDLRERAEREAHASGGASGSTAPGPSPAETRAGPAAAPVDDPEPDRLPAAGGDPRLPACSRSTPGTAATRAARGPLLADRAGDYLDGFLARATGQYSRMGALLDPIVDRLTILAGAAVCWHFELLPRWALAVLAVRELVTLVLARARAPARARARDQLVRPHRGLPDHGRRSSGRWSSTAWVMERDAHRRRRAGGARHRRLRAHGASSHRAPRLSPLHESARTFNPPLRSGRFRPIIVCRRTERKDTLWRRRPPRTSAR